MGRIKYLAIIIFSFQTFFLAANQSSLFSRSGFYNTRNQWERVEIDGKIYRVKIRKVINSNQDKTKEKHLSDNKRKKSLPVIKFFRALMPNLYKKYRQKETS